MATTGVSQLFVDTNVLVYATDANSPWQGLAETALADWQGVGAQLCVSVQVLREYLAVVTRTAWIGWLLFKTHDPFTLDRAILLSGRRPS